MTATTERCPGCHGSGIEMSGVTYAGMSEYVGCHECGPGCPDDCGCRVGPERHESVAPRHPGATQSPDGSQGATEGLRGAESAVTDAEAARWGALADAVTEGSWTASGRTVLGDGYGAEYVSIPEATRLAALIEARDREIRADECEEIAKAVWAARAERYPLDVFPKPPLEAYHAAHEALQAQGFTLDAMSADMFRRSYAALAKDADERATQHRGDKP